MARVKYWGITVVPDIEQGILVSMRYDGMFVITKNRPGIKAELKIFNPGDILDSKEKSIPKRFKDFISKYVDEKVCITKEVERYLNQMEKRLKK